MCTQDVHVAAEIAGWPLAIPRDTAAMSDSVCVFCGSNLGGDPAFAAAADALGTAIASSGRRLVYGGASVGLMGRLADAALAAGGEVLGIMPAALIAKEIGKTDLREFVIVESMHERKAAMADAADAFVALPGGMGTFEELCEMLTWAQLGLHRKRVVIFDVSGFYGPLFELFDRAVDAAFLRPEHRKLAGRATSVAEVMALLATAPPEIRPKWIDRDQT
jgi:uncharacterized protein (TIGR00730 family)